MCGRYGMFSTFAEIKDRFRVKIPDFELRTHYNAAPSQLLPVIIEHDQEHELKLMQWGLIPSWAKDASFQYKTINARAETITELASYKNVFKSRRCIIPANGFYEWVRDGKIKIPMYFTLKSEPIFAFAGLWDSWKNPLGQTVETFTIVTTEPNELVSKVHDRMPVILGENENEWLTNGNDKDFYLSLLKPYPADDMNVWQVSQLVNKSSYDSPELIEKVN